MLLSRFSDDLRVGAGGIAGAAEAGPSVGTLPTHRPLFAALRVGVIFIVVGLTYFPAQALDPIAEGLH
ncbi:MAG: potassium-transporting ATPase subunit KdpA [Pseudonocardiaceae bacterium]